MDVAREALEALGDAPDKRVDYAGWLQHCKAKWRLQRATRKRRRLEEEKALAAASGAIVGAMTPGRGMRTGPRLLGPGGLGAFVESRERTLQNAPWQLVQVERSAGGGPRRVHRVGARGRFPPRGVRQSHETTRGRDARRG